MTSTGVVQQVMNDATRATCILALEHRLDALRLDLAARRFDWFLREGWRGELHRDAMVSDIQAVRRALRELRPRFDGSREQTWEQLRALGYGELELRAAAGDR